MVGVGYGMLVR